MEKRTSREKVFSSTLVSLEIVPEKREVVLTVAEPQYLEKYHENLTETVKGFVVHFFRFATTWELVGTESKEDIGRLYNWLKYTVEPLIEMEVVRSLESLLGSSLLRSEVKVDKIVVNTSSGLENVRSKQKPVRCLVELDIEIHLSFPQPKPKYEALHIANKFFEFVYRRIRDLLVKATEEVLAQQNIEYKKLTNGPPAREAYIVDLLFTEGKKKEVMDFPMRWIFVLRFSEETFPSPESFSSLFEGIGRNLQQGPKEGLSSLLFTLSMIQPVDVLFYEENSYLRDFLRRINQSKVMSSRGLSLPQLVGSFTGSVGSGTNFTSFLLKTLEELQELLEEKERGVSL